MFAYIKGVLETKTNGYVVIDVSGIGYKIFMSDSTIAKIGEIGTVVKVHTHYHVREDNISLYGFYSNDELKMFELLLSVSGIGAKSAITILGAVEPSVFVLAVITNDVSKLTKIPGIGQKTAARMVLELKDKLKTDDASVGVGVLDNPNLNDANSNSNEITSALKVLGYTNKEIEKALQKIDISNLSIEQCIKNALLELGR